MACRMLVRLLLVAAGLLLAVACGQASPSAATASTRPTITATPTPTAAEILAKPALSAMKDMHFTASVRATSGGQTAELTGEGDMVVKPSSAFRLKVQGVVGGASVSQEIITKGGIELLRSLAHKVKAQS